MNKYFYVAIMVFSQLTANLFGMRSAIPFKGTNPSRSTKTMPASASEQGTTVNIPVESSNQALTKVVQEQQEEQGSSKKSKWHQNKKFKNTREFLTAFGLVTIMGKWAIYNISVDAQTQDPELYAVFLQIKKDMGITENIPLRILKPGYLINQESIACYHSAFNVIIIDPNFYQYDHPSTIIMTLAHELEHARQFLGYVDSYEASNIKLVFSKLQGKNSWSGTHLKLETGADAQAAGYFDCPECLKIVRLSGQPYNPSNLASGYFTTEEGYFAPQDYDPYIERACQEGEPCAAHFLNQRKRYHYFSQFFNYDPLHIPKNPSSFDKYWTDRFLAKPTKYFPDQPFPLNFYLPKSAKK